MQGLDKLDWKSMAMQSEIISKMNVSTFRVTVDIRS